MRVCVKKIHRPSCQRPVKGREQEMECGHIRVMCSKCGRLLYVWNGVTRRYAREGV